MDSCYFCKSSLIKVNKTSLIDVKSKSSKIKFVDGVFHECSCGMKFVTEGENELHSWSFKTTIKNKEYKLVFCVNMSNGPEFSLWSDSQELLCFNFLPNITQANAAEKIHFMLLFS